MGAGFSSITLPSALLSRVIWLLQHAATFSSKQREDSDRAQYDRDTVGAATEKQSTHKEQTQVYFFVYTTKAQKQNYSKLMKDNCLTSPGRTRYWRRICSNRKQTGGNQKTHASIVLVIVSNCNNTC